MAEGGLGSMAIGYAGSSHLHWGGPRTSHKTSSSDLVSRRPKGSLSCKTPPSPTSRSPSPPSLAHYQGKQLFLPSHYPANPAP